jgi:hypothetical protein
MAGFVLALAAACALPHLFPTALVRLITWAIVAVGVVLILTTIEGSVSNPIRHLLIDERNRYSLPNLVTLAWFVTIVSAYLSTALWNMWTWKPESGAPLPIAITIPPSIWVLAGIVSTGLIGTGIIIGTKRASAGTRASGADADFEVRGAGRLLVRSSEDEANLSDLVTYDERGLEDKTDMAAVQQLLFQVAAVIVYVVALGRLMLATDAQTPILAFPVIPEGFLALLGVAQLTALINRAVPR